MWDGGTDRQMGGLGTVGVARAASPHEPNMNGRTSHLDMDVSLHLWKTRRARPANRTDRQVLVPIMEEADLYKPNDGMTG